MVEAAAKASPFAALGHRDFRYYTAGRFLATIAVQMTSLAVGFQVWDLTHRKIALAYVGLAQFLPIVSLSLGAGQVADRVDRRLILALCDLVFAACAAALYLVARSPEPRPAMILAVLAIHGAARAFYGPAGSALLPSLVPREHFTNAVAWQSTLWQIAAVSGPSVAGLLYGASGRPDRVYLLAAASLTLSAICFSRICKRPEKLDRVPATLATALAGVRYVFRNKLVLGATSLDLFAVFLGGATALLPVFATDVLAVGPHGLGVMRAAPAVGAGLTAAFLAFRPLGGRAGPKLLAGVAVFGAATIAFGLSRSYPLSLLCLAVLGGADMVSVVVRSTLIQAATPPEVRGRVSAVNLIFIGASNELGELESGTLAEWIGAVPAVIAGGAGTLLVVLIWALGFPAIRRVDRLEDVKPEADDRLSSNDLPTPT